MTEDLALQEENALENAVNLSPGVATLLSILFVLVFAALTVFLFFRIRRERNRFIAEKLKTNNIGKAGFDEMIARRIRVAKKTTHFTAMFIRLYKAEDLLKSLGEKQYGATMHELENRFCSVLPKGANVTIYENDLFAAYFDGDLDRKAVSDLAAFCIAEGTKPITLITKIKVDVEISIGAAIFSYEEKATAEQFFASVRHALMLSEAKGVNKYVIYSPEADFADDENVKFYQDIRKAIENGEFLLSYQPIMSMKKELIAYESFLRWNHKEYGMMRANKFLPMLVQSGDIQRIGMDAFTQLCLALNKYRMQNDKDKSVVFSMNFGTRQLLLSTFSDDIYKVLKRYHLSVSDVCIEVSDFKTPEVLDTLRKMRDHGFRIAVDGFHLEGSSDMLNELQLLSPEWIKLPYNFIQQCETNFFAKGMIEMLVRFANDTGVKLIATNVETAEEAAYAEKMGIGFGQGHFFGEEVEDL